MRRALPLALLVAALAAAGCQSAPEKSLPTVQTSALAPLPEDAGPWKPQREYEEIAGPWRVADGQFEQALATLPVSTRAEAVDPFEAAPAVAPATPQPVVRRSRGPKLAVPRRRAAREARPVGKKATKNAEQLAHEHFLDYPTRVKARKLTLHLPPAFAAEVRLTGASVSPLQHGRRQALGAARLVVRELTLEAERVTLRVRTDGRPDVQIMARGDVTFVADVRGNVLREEGLRSLLITNDQVVPIR
ncbi:MAG: hypothetical protein P1V36_03195 [Planctomycetota bacterium]|nr:hypothetical protein [Planctomycetota bacterium]